MNHIGLFEGIGGFSLAANWMGWETIAWCEINPFCQRVLKYYIPKAKAHDDIKNTDFSIYRGKCNVLTGGFPCQPYSVAGDRKGKEDDRHLWPEMLRSVREIQPSFVVGENVSGLTNWNRGMVFDEVQADLEAEGYEVTPFLLPACAVNAPHRRDRIWFIAYSNSNRNRNIQRQDRKANCLQKFYRTAVCSRQPFGANTEYASNSGISGLQGGENNGDFGSSRAQRNEQSTRLLQPTWNKFPTQSPLCSRNDGISTELSGITFSKHRNESIKAYGNAIVPQVAFQIFKAIEQLEIIYNTQTTEQ